MFNYDRSYKRISLCTLIGLFRVVEDERTADCDRISRSIWSSVRGSGINHVACARDR